MILAGIQRTSLVDWPEKICSTVFLAGCNFRCPFCHNPELVLPEEIERCESMTETELLTALVERKRFIDGVAITGGEPLLSPDLPKLIRKIKDKGFAVKVDTNGTVPQVLKKLIEEELIDYVAMDIKAPKDKYDLLTNSKVKMDLIEQSIKILLKGDVPYEFRTTVVKGLLTKEDILGIADWIKGADHYCLQQFVSTEKTLDPDYKDRKAFPPETLHEMMEAISDKFKKVSIRGI